MKPGLYLIGLWFYLQSLSVFAHPANQPIRFTVLSFAQQQVVNNYIRRNEKPTGELKVLSNRGAAFVRSSPADFLRAQNIRVVSERTGGHADERVFRDLWNGNELGEPAPWCFRVVAGLSRISLSSRLFA